MTSRLRTSLLGVSITYIIVFFIAGWTLLFYLLFSLVSGYVLNMNRVTFDTFYGQNYMITYPKDWKVRNGEAFGYTFIAGNGQFVGISTRNAEDASTTLAERFDVELNSFKTNSKVFEQIGSNKTVNLRSGSWLEAEFTNDLTLFNGKHQPQHVIFAMTSHRTEFGALNFYAIEYSADPYIFSASSQVVFQPMWQSFRFLSSRGIRGR